MNNQKQTQEIDYMVYPCNQQVFITNYCAVYHNKGCDKEKLCTFATKSIEKKLAEQVEVVRE